MNTEIKYTPLHRIMKKSTSLNRAHKVANNMTKKYKNYFTVLIREDGSKLLTNKFDPNVIKNIR